MRGPIAYLTILIFINIYTYIIIYTNIYIITYSGYLLAFAIICFPLLESRKTGVSGSECV